MEKFEWKGIARMLGWMIMFAMMVILSALRMLSGHPEPSARIATVLFTALFVAGLLASAARGRTS
jgi:uncharacterized membrane protein YtjA (UPF0391 family)